MYGVWTGGWKDVGSPREHCQGALEQGTELLYCAVYSETVHYYVLIFFNQEF